MTECAGCAPISVTFISGPTAACTVPDRGVQYTGNQYALCTLNDFQTKVLGVRLRSCWPCRAGGSRRVTTCSQLYVPGWHMYRRVRHGIDSEYETNERHVPGWPCIDVFDMESISNMRLTNATCPAGTCIDVFDMESIANMRLTNATFPAGTCIDVFDMESIANMRLTNATFPAGTCIDVFDMESIANLSLSLSLSCNPSRTSMMI